MDFHQKLTTAWVTHDTLLCVGLDPDLAKFPIHLACAAC
jgi:orotidine-5'-phosphate decarboxylase